MKRYECQNLGLSTLCLALLFLAFTVEAGELPPDVRAKRYLIEIDMAVQARDHVGAVKIFEEKLFPLREALIFPPEIDYHYAKALSEVGRMEEALDVLAGYLANPEHDKNYLDTVLRLQITLEQRIAMEKEAALERERELETKREYERRIEEKKALEKEKFERVALDCGEGVILEFVKIPAGMFMMGSPATEEARRDKEYQRQVTIGKPFYMGIYEVTQAQYQAVMGKNPSHYKKDDFPVERVSWKDAVDFCRNLSIKTGRKVRLPTEAEWEYSCRAGTTTPFNTGETISTDQANFRDDGGFVMTNYSTGKGVFRNTSMIVGSFSPNEWGLYDMHGNVQEWCSDWFGDWDFRNAIDPQRATSDDKYIIIRGGAQSSQSSDCRSARRDSVSNPDYRNDECGFRVLLEE